MSSSITCPDCGQENLGHRLDCPALNKLLGDTPTVMQMPERLDHATLLNERSELQAEVDELRRALAHKEALADSWRTKCMEARDHANRLHTVVEKYERDATAAPGVVTTRLLTRAQVEELFGVEPGYEGDIRITGVLTKARGPDSYGSPARPDADPRFAKPELPPPPACEACGRTPISATLHTNEVYAARIRELESEVAGLRKGLDAATALCKTLQPSLTGKVLVVTRYDRMRDGSTVETPVCASCHAPVPDFSGALTAGAPVAAPVVTIDETLCAGCDQPITPGQPAHRHSDGWMVHDQCGTPGPVPQSALPYPIVLDMLELAHRAKALVAVIPGYGDRVERVNDRCQLISSLADQVRSILDRIGDVPKV